MFQELPRILPLFTLRFRRYHGYCRCLPCVSGATPDIDVVYLVFRVSGATTDIDVVYLVFQAQPRILT